MNRTEVIKWCKDYLPVWPTADGEESLKRLARPLAWKWVITRLPYQRVNSLVLTKTGKFDHEFITKGHVFPAIAPPISLNFNRVDAINWCKNSLLKWPEKVTTMLASPPGWKWSGGIDISPTATTNVLLISPDHLPIISSAVFPAPPVPKLVQDFLEIVRKNNDLKEANKEPGYLLMDEKEFEELALLYPAFNRRVNDDRTGAIFEGLVIRKVNDDISIIANFLTEHADCFKDYITRKNRDIDDFNEIFETLIYSS